MRDRINQGQKQNACAAGAFPSVLSTLYAAYCLCRLAPMAGRTWVLSELRCWVNLGAGAFAHSEGFSWKLQGSIGQQGSTAALQRGEQKGRVGASLTWLIPSTQAQIWGLMPTCLPPCLLDATASCTWPGLLPFTWASSRSYSCRSLPPPQRRWEKESRERACVFSASFLSSVGS